MTDSPRSPSEGFQHCALAHSSDDELVNGLAPFIRDGLAAGQPVVTVASDRTAALLSDALGADQQRVRFLHATDVYGSPGRALQNYEALLADYLGEGAESVRVIGEIPFGEISGTQREWMRYESALNDLFSRAPVCCVCPYDKRTLPDEVVTSAARTHPLLTTATKGWHYSGEYTPPARFLRELTAWERARASLLADLSVGRDLSHVRTTVRRLAKAQGATSERAEQFVNAINEVATNALTHGEEPVRLRLLADDYMLMCEVSDHGTGLDDPLAAYRLPAANDEQEGGRGLWLARELCDVVELESRPGGFAVHLAMSVTDGDGFRPASAPGS